MSPDADVLDRVRTRLLAAGVAPTGAEVAIREKRRGVPWVKATIAAVGPAVESAPEYPGLDATIPSRGIPLRIALPKGLDLTPGALVEVRFARSGQ